MDNSLLALIAIIAILVGFIVVISHLARPKMNKPHFQKKWRSIEQAEPSSLSIIQADSLVDEAMRHYGIKGGTMGERLNNATGVLSDINGSWSAHKLRNRIAHESSVTIGDKDLARALRQFKKALKDLGAL